MDVKYNEAKGNQRTFQMHEIYGCFQKKHYFIMN